MIKGERRARCRKIARGMWGALSEQGEWSHAAKIYMAPLKVSAHARITKYIQRILDSRRINMKQDIASG